MAAAKFSLDYDYSLMLGASVGGAGFPDGELPALQVMLGEVRRRLLGFEEDHALGFMTIPERDDELRATAALARDVSRKAKTLVVVGIGGSDLGARAFLAALPSEKSRLTVRFIGANTDPEEIDRLLREIKLKETVVNIISKSGDTVEPMATFLLLRDKLRRATGATGLKERVVATTDAERGTLRQMADREGWRTLPVPRDIGGRFSALTPVGLFPAACGGADIRGLVAGAGAVLDDFRRAPVNRCGPLLFAGFEHDGFVRRNRRLTVLMPYAESLRQFAFWFRQLWGESLGKRRDRRGREVHVGLTPVAALGATDQHSQIQLYNEGPRDKSVTFIEVEKFRADFAVPNPYPKVEGTAYLAGKKFSQIIHAERQATALALAQAGRPNGTIRIDAITPQSVGGLMMFFMLATAAAGELFDINAYDQPGVEQGKKNMYALLGRKGYSLE
ncbi:hypothetical protein A3C96_02525 [Candidatus Uhrbacteria bacterium RIFCSPHIGHO2_02_FULL_60_10]|uniref:Glucose-6-phosphate isomerase n=1 Tax=Candidatus Uhrbacteria bacterium RIFCSPHIGHO2_02_FULL_60_10 TaxID=1802392 RepID=A0A1F7U3S6_9BACT|nr:MAG: hypothetical protein A3C96_02525 [Candidatus Uhrbacteria bacterium RIFCSPHIGHO2_02_FULL_60_10]